MWPFGTSRKDRRRIDALESTIEDLRDQIKELRGKGTLPRYYIYGSGEPCDRVLSLADVEKRLEETDRTINKIMQAAGLERVTQPSKTWIQKKRK